MSHRTEQPFEQPWHAAAFALTVHLRERGLFSWTNGPISWPTRLPVTDLAGQLDGGDDYYTAWLAALQTLDEKGVCGDHPRHDGRLDRSLSGNTAWPAGED